MNRTKFLSALICMAGVVGLFSCGPAPQVPDSGADPVKVDGGSRPDAGPSSTSDAGTPDAGTGTPDAGGGKPDAGIVDAGCTPFTHQSQGFNGDLTVQRYRIVGASPDGQRIALLTSHFGPSSGDPFTNVIGYRAGSTTKLFAVLRARFGGGTSESELAGSELETLADPETIAVLQDAGIVLNAVTDGGLPNTFAPVAWCANGQSIAGQPPTSFDFHSATCSFGQEVEWSLCSSANCLEGLFECSTPLADPVLVDRFIIHGVDWAITEQMIQAISPLRFTWRTAAGGSLSTRTP